MLIGPQERRSNRRQLESSEPLPTTVPEGKNSTLLMSLMWPVNVRTHELSRMSHTRTVESQLPDANTLGSVGWSDTLRRGAGDGRGKEAE